MTKEQKALKYLTFGAILLICDLLQNTAGLFLEINGARCFLLLPAAVILSMNDDEKYGALIGLFAGLLWDLSSGVHMGFNTIFMMIICFFASALVTYIVRDTFITNMVAAIFSIILYCFVYWLFFIVIKGVDGGALTLFTFFVPCMLYTSVLSPVLWIFLRRVRKKFKIQIHFGDE